MLPVAVRSQSGCMEKFTAISQELGCRFGGKREDGEGRGIRTDGRVEENKFGFT